MAKKTEIRAVDKNVMGGTKKGVSAKGPFGGGTPYNRMKLDSKFGMPKPTGLFKKNFK